MPKPGPQPKYNEPSKVLSIRVPESMHAKIKALVYEHINKQEVPQPQFYGRVYDPETGEMVYMGDVT